MQQAYEPFSTATTGRHLSAYRSFTTTCRTVDVVTEATSAGQGLQDVITVAGQGYCPDTITFIISLADKRLRQTKAMTTRKQISNCTFQCTFCLLYFYYTCQYINITKRCKSYVLNYNKNRRITFYRMSVNCLQRRSIVIVKLKLLIYFLYTPLNKIITKHIMMFSKYTYVPDSYIAPLP